MLLCVTSNTKMYVQLMLTNSFFCFQGRKRARQRRGECTRGPGHDRRFHKPNPLYTSAPPICPLLPNMVSHLFFLTYHGVTAGQRPPDLYNSSQTSPIRTRPNHPEISVLACLVVAYLSSS